MGDRSGKGLSLLFAHHVFLSLQIRKFNLEMNNNRRLLIYGAACVVVLAVAVSIFFVKLFVFTIIDIVRQNILFHIVESYNIMFL